VADLLVELYGIEVGRLVGTDWRTFDFRASDGGLQRFGLGSTILSEAVPLELRARRGRAPSRRNYFAELLPEGQQRQYLADQARVRDFDTVAMLARYGRDVAGAVQIWDPADPGEPRVPFVEPISDGSIATMLADSRQYPLGNLPTTGKSLINGVQTKILVTREHGAWFLPGDGYPSTHILKPMLDDVPTMIFDEEYGARLARRLGLASHATWIEDFDGIATLVVERYDRADDGSRIHQEDMNQALGASGNEKYQKIGGVMSLRRIAALLEARAARGSRERLARTTVLTVAVGNLDMHAKNISLLHPLAGDPQLAPAYDVVPMTHLDNDQELALAVNDVYRHGAVTMDDLVSEFGSWGLADARELTAGTLEAIGAAARDETPSAGAWSGVQDTVLTVVGNLLSGRAAGEGR
jgi:serine/threonine-protein kinase HipA